MANNKISTVFQNLDNIINGGWNSAAQQKNAIANKDINGVSLNHTYNMSDSEYGKKVIYSTPDKDKYEKKKLELQQNRYLASKWQKANVNLSIEAYNGLNNVKLMYRDADLMDAMPEIASVLDTYMEESTTKNADNQLVSVYSKSNRIKSILEDLFVNRLELNIMAPMIVRAMCKYGNQFMLLNVDKKLGVTGWKQLPVNNVERLENGLENGYVGMGISNATASDTDLSTRFMWTDYNSSSQVAFRNWQVAHFRIISNSIYLPYGVSIMQGARRHWRLLSLMEDMMLIYRLERSVERRVYKIFVGALDDADVQAYVEEVANNFKRTPIIDPETGQVDLRKNILPVHKDTPIPLLDGRTITIANLAKEFESGKENYVYSVQDKTSKIVAGKVVWCGKNYTADELIKVTLDDNTYVILAKEHEFIMRNGTKKRADEIQVGDSVMPFYTSIDTQAKNAFQRYEKIYNPQSGKYEYTHRLIASEVSKANDQFNKDKRSIYFDNYIWEELRKLIVDNRINTAQDILNVLNNDYMNHLHEINHIDFNTISKNVLRRHIQDKGFDSIPEYIKAMRINHKVSKIEIITGDDVYCMTVVGINGEEDRHNFAVCTLVHNGVYGRSGCFVSNCVDNDVFIPTRDPSAPNPIETLPAGQNLTAIDDIKYIQAKMLTGLHVPRSFIDVDNNPSEGTNLAMMDIRFTRTVNRVQQAFLMELTKVASIHLYLLGFEDELNNFSLSMNNPSTQAEQLEIDNIAKKIDAVRNAVSDPGNGIQVMSMSRALRDIMKWSDKDIQDNLEEIRLEKAISTELEKTSQIIKKTGIFDHVDKLYGEPGAEYQDGQDAAGGDPMGGGAGGGGGMPSLGGPDLGGGPDMGMGDDTASQVDGMDNMGSEGGDIQGNEGEQPLSDAGPMEDKRSEKPLILEKANKGKTLVERATIYDKALLFNEEYTNLMNNIDSFLQE